MTHVLSLEKLLSIAVALGAREVSGWSRQEAELVRDLPLPSEQWVSWAHNLIRDHGDPLGTLFCELYTAEERRSYGAVYTPSIIVDAMLRWARSRSNPERVVDPGTGSGRFLLGAGRVFKQAQLLGIESDPRAAILARGQLAAAGLAERSQILLRDYRSSAVNPFDKQTLFIGNPPYVRHHLIDKQWKTWLQTKAKKYGFTASALAGLHVYFYLATLEYARKGDLGVFITSNEWLDVNYGRIVKQLLLNQLGGINLQIIEPTVMPFPGISTTGVITGFKIGDRTNLIGIRRIENLDSLGSLKPEWMIERENLSATSRWSTLTRTVPKTRSDFVELGELCRVHRGQVTGANRVWIINQHTTELPNSVLYPTVTRANELFNTDGVLESFSGLRHVIDIPTELDKFSENELIQIKRYLEYAKELGADRSYIAKHRKAWWSVGLRDPAPILATYMARRPPIFVFNRIGARHINIAHGLYPRQEFEGRVLMALAKYLSNCVSTSQGRTYAGGLTKFEPREMEKLLVPRPEVLINDVEFDEFVR